MKRCTFLILIVLLAVIPIACSDGSSNADSTTQEPKATVRWEPAATVGPKLISKEVCAIARGKCNLCARVCLANWNDELERWWIACSGAVFSYREATGILVAESPDAKRCSP